MSLPDPERDRRAAFEMNMTRIEAEILEISSCDNGFDIRVKLTACHDAVLDSNLLTGREGQEALVQYRAPDPAEVPFAHCTFTPSDFDFEPRAGQKLAAHVRLLSEDQDLVLGLILGPTAAPTLQD